MRRPLTTPLQLHNSRTKVKGDIAKQQNRHDEDSLQKWFYFSSLFLELKADIDVDSRDDCKVHMIACNSALMLSMNNRIFYKNKGEYLTK